MPEYEVLRCCQCEIFQIQQVKKVKKWNCVSCGTKQSTKKVYARSFNSGELRRIVQDYNMKRGELEEQEKKLALLFPPATSSVQPQAIRIAEAPVRPIATEPQASSSHVAPETGNIVSAPSQPSEPTPSHPAPLPSNSPFVSPFSSASSASDVWKGSSSHAKPKIIRYGI